MSILQFLISLSLERIGVNDNGDNHVYMKSYEIDLCSNDIIEQLHNFLNDIPEDISVNSNIMIAIRNKDGKIIPFVDGMAYTMYDDWTRGPTKRISEIENEFADNMRKTISIFADRKYKK